MTTCFSLVRPCLQENVAQTKCTLFIFSSSPLLLASSMEDRELRHSTVKMFFMSGTRSATTRTQSEMRSTSSSVIICKKQTKATMNTAPRFSHKRSERRTAGYLSILELSNTEGTMFKAHTFLGSPDFPRCKILAMISMQFAQNTCKKKKIKQTRLIYLVIFILCRKWAKLTFCFSLSSSMSR